MRLLFENSETIDVEFASQPGVGECAFHRHAVQAWYLERIHVEPTCIGMSEELA